MVRIEKIGWGFGRCNMKCAHCYNASHMRGVPVYDFSVLKSVADKICPRIKDVNFGTGELLCNPNALELVEYIANTYAHIDMSVTSNGYTIVKVNAAKVKRLFNDVDISIDFPSKERHNAFRKHSQAWDWAIGALEILQTLRIQHTVVTCVTSQTTDADLMGLLDLSKRYQSFMRINWYREVGRGVDTGLRITAKRAWEIIALLAPRVEFSSMDSVFAGPLGVACKPCPAGVKSARIHEDGSVTAYPFLKGKRWSAGNILDESTTLESIYNSPVFTRLRERPLPNACRSCDFSATCQGGCVTRQALHAGGLDCVDDYCPVQARLLPDVKNLAGQVRIHKIGNLVHDGYLCTTIMRPL